MSTMSCKLYVGQWFNKLRWIFFFHPFCTIRTILPDLYTTQTENLIRFILSHCNNNNSFILANFIQGKNVDCAIYIFKIILWSQRQMGKKLKKKSND